MSKLVAVYVFALFLSFSGTAAYSQEADDLTPQEPPVSSETAEEDPYQKLDKLLTPNGLRDAVLDKFGPKADEPKDARKVHLQGTAGVMAQSTTGVSAVAKGSAQFDLEDNLFFKLPTGGYGTEQVFKLDGSVALGSTGTGSIVPAFSIDGKFDFKHSRRGWLNPLVPLFSDQLGSAAERDHLRLSLDHNVAMDRSWRALAAYGTDTNLTYWSRDTVFGDKAKFTTEAQAGVDRTGDIPVPFAQGYVAIAGKTCPWKDQAMQNAFCIAGDAGAGVGLLQVEGRAQGSAYFAHKISDDPAKLFQSIEVGPTFAGEAKVDLNGFHNAANAALTITVK